MLGEYALVPNREGSEPDTLRMCVCVHMCGTCPGTGLSSRKGDMVGSFITSEIPAWPPVSKAQKYNRALEGVSYAP